MTSRPSAEKLFGASITETPEWKEAQLRANIEARDAVDRISILDIHSLPQPTELQRLAEAVMASKCRVEQLDGQALAERERLAELAKHLEAETQRVLREVGS